MKTDHYKDSPIDEVTFKRAPNGTLRAYIHAIASIDPSTRDAISKSAIDQGLMVLPSTCHQKPVLELRGFMRESAITNWLSKHQWIQGPAARFEQKDTQQTWMQWLSSKSLPIASGLFLLGDAGYIKYGFNEGRMEDVAAGVSYMAGSGTMGILGTGAQATAEIRRNVKALAQFAATHHIDLSKNLTIPTITEDNKRSVFQHVLDFLQTYPAEIGNSFTAIAGGLLLTSALRHRVLEPHMATNKRFTGLLDVGLGATTVISGLIGAWVKEKTPDSNAPKSTGVQALWEFIQEKPLRTAAFGYMVGTGAHMLSTSMEYRIAKATNDQKSLSSIPWRAFFITMTILAEMTLSLGSKGHGEGVKSDTSTDESVMSVAAEIIAQQPSHIQLLVADQVAGFLARHDVLGGTIESRKKELHTQMLAIQTHPWSQPVLDVTRDPHLPIWQEQLAARVPPQGSIAAQPL